MVEIDWEKEEGGVRGERMGGGSFERRSRDFGEEEKYGQKAA